MYLRLLRVDAIAQRIDRALSVAHFVERGAAELTGGRNVTLKDEHLREDGGKDGVQRWMSNSVIESWRINFFLENGNNRRSR